MSTIKPWLPSLGAGVLVLVLAFWGARMGEAGQDTEEHLRPPGSVEIYAYPWARLSIDGVSLGLTPRSEAARLDAGEHLIRAEHPTLGAREMRIIVRPGVSEVLVIDMDPRTADEPARTLSERLERRRRDASPESLLVLALATLERIQNREMRRLATRHAAHALLRLNRSEEARDILQKHLDLDPEFAPDPLRDSPLIVSLWPTRPS